MAEANSRCCGGENVFVVAYFGASLQVEVDPHVTLTFTRHGFENKHGEGQAKQTFERPITF